jgi:myosin heavy subunit
MQDAGDFERVKNLMSVLGISKTTQLSMFRTLSAVLHLGNVTFLWDEEQDALVLKSDKVSSE